MWRTTITGLVFLVEVVQAHRVQEILGELPGASGNHPPSGTGNETDLSHRAGHATMEDVPLIRLTRDLLSPDRYGRWPTHKCRGWQSPGE